MKVTVPVAAEGATVAVNVTLAPIAGVVVDAVSAVVVAVNVLLQVVPLTANDAGTAFVVPFQVPLNPTPVTLPPAATLPLYGSFFTVTTAPLWVSMPFQRDDTVCPLAKVQVSVQLVQDVVPVFWIVMAAPKALEFCGEIV
jgi:hypothetical protein